MYRLDYEIDVFKAFLLVCDREPVFLDSRYRVKDTGDNTIILFDPKYAIKQENSIVSIIEKGQETIVSEDFLKLVDSKLKIEKPLGTGLVFDGGFAGYLSYDFGMEILSVESKNKKTIATPEAYLAYYEDFIIVDHKKGITYIVTEEENLFLNIKDEEKISKDFISQYPILEELVPNIEKEEFENGVEKVRQYIRQGEVYQVNISQQFSGAGNINPYKLYEKLREANYGPYNAFLDVNGKYIMSTSPEQLFKKRGDKITTRPIKGTIRKGKTREENQLLQKELLNSEKNRAELLMIVDLERNDLSRVCKCGTVKVPELFSVEEYATVNHLVATVEGELNAGITFEDIIRAIFPGGSITGAPKLRAVEVIEETEQVARGVYTGSIGYISTNGNMDFNIAIRTLIASNKKIIYNVGGGITWDSVPEEEYQETLDKGKAIHKVLTE